jgi:two-component system cell cycle response regulator CtrA
MRVLLFQCGRSVETWGIDDGNAVIERAESADEAMSLLLLETYDLALLDMMLIPDDGFDLIRRLRKSRNDTPILALTGVAACDRTIALRLGADDAMPDPVDSGELRARMRSVVRRSVVQSDSLVQLGDLGVNLATGDVSFSDAAIRLTRKEFSILELMVRRRNQMVTKQTILNHLYGGTDEPCAKIVDVFVCKLRKKLEHAGLVGAITTIWGGGYMMAEMNARIPAISVQTEFAERQLTN